MAGLFPRVLDYEATPGYRDSYTVKFCIGRGVYFSGPGQGAVVRFRFSKDTPSLNHAGSFGGISETNCIPGS